MAVTERSQQLLIEKDEAAPTGIAAAATPEISSPSEDIFASWPSEMSR